MNLSSPIYKKVKSEYLKFIKSQEVLSEPFRDKISQLDKFYLPISKRIYESYNIKKKTQIIGLTGGQGSGKSTISNILKIILKVNFNLKTVIFSIDDFYKTLEERKKMSLKISPLFLVRGVPGTHDTALLLNCLKQLKSIKFKKFLIPRFDKSTDDRHLKKNWQKVNSKPDIVIFEGWCVGAIPQKNKELLRPLNIMEKKRDIKGIWRKKVNKELKNKYRQIFKLIDTLIFLKVPSFKHVYKWRLLQEKKLQLISKGKKTMSEKQIKNFIMFYERLTKHMLKNVSKKAHTVLKIDYNHKLKSLKFK
jgi:D-glycerate 3-kinase